MSKVLKEPTGVSAKVEALVRPSIEALGLRLWDVRYEKEGSLWFLRIFIDREEGVLDTDTCEAASRAIDPILDEADPIEQSYMLEVGSPGLGRKLTRRIHFDWLQGQDIRIVLYAPDAEGRKEVRGTLVGLADDQVVLQTPEGEVSVPVQTAGSFKTCDDECLFD